jgi:hypothetical protein
VTEEAELSALLDSVPVPPGRITADAAVQFGRRSVRRRRHLAVGGAAIALTAVTITVSSWTGPRQATPPLTPPSLSPSLPQSPSVQPKPVQHWVLKDLPVPPEIAYLSFGAIDPTGKYIVGQADPNLVVWTNGVPAVVDLPEEVDQLFSVDVNSSGVIVGEYSYNEYEKFTGFVHKDGVTTRLRKPGNSTDFGAYRIDEAGNILGKNKDGKHFMWPAGDWDHPVELKAPGKWASVSDRRADGLLVGNIGDGDHPYVWNPDGTGHPLKEREGQPGGKAERISGAWVCGYVIAPNTDSNLIAARWNLTADTLEVFPDVASVIFTITSQGAMLSPGAGWSVPTVITPEGQVVKLPLDVSGHYTAWAMNDKATMVIGLNQAMGGQPKPVIWVYE